MRLDNTVNEIQEALENLTDEEVQEYYRKEFRDLAGKFTNSILYSSSSIRGNVFILLCSRRNEICYVQPAHRLGRYK